MKNNIAYTKPSISDLEVKYATDAALNGWGDQCYAYIQKFENAFKKHLGVKHAIATSSATGALHMGMAALGIGEGDEVILANTNWIASVAPILHLKAKPVFVDIKEDSWCIDSSLIEKAITEKTKAIMAVHLYGNLCDMDKLRSISDKYNLFLIEDAAEAIGSSYNGNKAGSIGDFGAFSFHGTKTITTGEGGMFTTNSDELYEHVLTLSNHGRSRSQKKQFWPDMLGYKYKMSNVQAAIGLAQTERIEDLINKKIEIFKVYEQLLQDFDEITLNPAHNGVANSGYWITNIVFNKKLNITRNEVITKFENENIDARVFFWPLSSLEFINEEVDTPIAFDISERAINLPSFNDITYLEQERVIKVIKDLIKAR
tara:strand:- start:93 stop:1208 length:1116 start_codon:yes stop_codon:yes gene_type:complete